MPRAIDTNVLVRILTDDGSDQVDRARALLGEGDLLVTSGVLLETEWVLRGRYNLDRRQIATLLANLLRLRAVTVADELVVRTALQAYGEGMDFADALHLAASADCSAFLTFDRSLQKREMDLKLSPPVHLA
jgi:predicted nucleic-acid-binding protein